jgi:iron(III)-salmochelin esterase
VQATDQALQADATPHELTLIPGPHGYGFNRGPGGFEMLLWHERAARGLPSP